MGIINRRNAVVGWLVLKGAKRAGRRKAQDGGRGPRAGAAVAAVGAALGGLLVWRKWRRTDAGDDVDMDE
jgi:hypothetical protein